MCDFHSIAVRKDGAIAHLPSNSHSGAVEAAGWRENQPNRDPFFNECVDRAKAEAEKEVNHESYNLPRITRETLGCEKHRYPDKKSAVSAINNRTRGHQRNRPAALRAYCCPRCGGWHLTHEDKDSR